MTYHAYSNLQQKSNAGTDAYVVEFDAISSKSKVQGRKLIVAGDGCLYDSTESNNMISPRI